MYQKWEGNDHKIPRNGPNNPKIGPNMYLDVFYQVLPFFAQNNAFFVYFSHESL